MYSLVILWKEKNTYDKCFLEIARCDLVSDCFRVEAESDSIRDGHGWKCASRLRTQAGRTNSTAY